MASFSMLHDIGAYLTVKEMVSPRRVSNSTGGTTINGTIIDRRAGAGDLADSYHSLKLAIPYNTGTMTTGSSVAVVFAVHHSSSTATAGFSLLPDIDGTTSAITGISYAYSTAAGGDSDSGVVVHDYRLDYAKRYIRVEAELFNSGSTATNVDYSVVGIFGAGDNPPAS